MFLVEHKPSVGGAALEQQSSRSRVQREQPGLNWVSENLASSETWAVLTVRRDSPGNVWEAL